MDHVMSDSFFARLMMHSVLYMDSAKGLSGIVLSASNKSCFAKGMQSSLSLIVKTASICPSFISLSSFSWPTLCSTHCRWHSATFAFSPIRVLACSTWKTFCMHVCFTARPICSKSLRLWWHAKRTSSDVKKTVMCSSTFCKALLQMSMSASLIPAAISCCKPNSGAQYISGGLVIMRLPRNFSAQSTGGRAACKAYGTSSNTLLKKRSTNQLSFNSE